MMMLNIKKLCLNVATALIFPTAAMAQLGDQGPAPKPSPHMESHVGNLTGHSEAGRQLFFRYCWGCHGARGNGDGENAPSLNILPRNFVAPSFSAGSTP